MPAALLAPFPTSNIIDLYGYSLGDMTSKNLVVNSSCVPSLLDIFFLNTSIYPVQYVLIILLIVCPPLEFKVQQGRNCVLFYFLLYP